MMRCPKQPALACHIVNIGASARLMVVFSGFYENHELLHRAMCAVLYCRIATAIEMASKGGGMLLIVVLIVFLAAAGAIRSE